MLIHTACDSLHGDLIGFTIYRWHRSWHHKLCHGAYLASQLLRTAAGIELENIPQLVNPNEVADRTLLPSFLYIPGEMDFPKGSLKLPWDKEPKFVIGELARKRGAENPVRLVASAKSWLSNAAVNRTAPILPWQSPDEVSKLSPVEASSQYLRYLRTAWDSNHADQPLGRAGRAAYRACFV